MAQHRQVLVYHKQAYCFLAQEPLCSGSGRRGNVDLTLTTIEKGPSTMAEFPLAQWFDLTKPIAGDDRELAEAQMALYVYKDTQRVPCEHR
jgi:hypothetical protein